MSIKKEPSQIRQLLVLLSTAVLSGFLIAGYFLYAYGPSGQYTLNHVLLAPNLMHSLSFKEEAAKKNVRYLFKKLEFTYFDPTRKQWQITLVSPDKYAEWYTMIQSDKSLNPIRSEIAAQFTTAILPSLALNVYIGPFSDVKSRELSLKSKTNSSGYLGINQEGSPDSTRVMQEVQFANEGNHYRVRLYEQGNSDSWAYFYHENILATSIKMLASP